MIVIQLFIAGKFRHFQDLKHIILKQNYMPDVATGEFGPPIKFCKNVLC